MILKFELTYDLADEATQAEQEEALAEALAAGASKLSRTHGRFDYRGDLSDPARVETRARLLELNDRLNSLFSD